MDTFLFDEIIGIKVAADYSHLSQRHVRLLLEKGRIRGRKVGHDWITTRMYLDEYISVPHPRGRKPAVKA